MISITKYILKRYLKQIIEIILVGIITIIASLSFVVLSKRVIDNAIDGDYYKFYYYSAILVLVIAIQIAFSLLSNYIVSYYSNSMANSLRNSLYRHIVFAKWFELKNIHSSDIIIRFIKDVDDIVTLFISSIPKFILAVLQFIVTVIALYYLNPILSILLAVGTPIIAFLGKFYYYKMRKITDEIKVLDSNINKHIQETFINHNVVKAFDRQQYEIEKLSSMQNQLLALVKKRTMFSLYNSGMFSLSFNGGYIGTFLFGGFLLIKKMISFGAFTAYLQLVLRIQRPIQDIIAVIPNFVYARSSFDRLSFLFKIEIENKEKMLLKSGKLSLTINNMTFGYDDDTRNIYDNFNLYVESGQFIAFMGETGSGKTTFIRLLLGFISPTSGFINISDGSNTYLVDDTTRSNFVYVPQGNHLFSGSVRENLLIGNKNASDEKISKAIIVACAEFIYDLPNGLDYIIQENHLSISEGQAQRISIARALLSDSKIMLMDEATSALDEDTEIKLFNNLKKYYRDRIIIFVTHHNRIAKLCDKIVRIE